SIINRLLRRETGCLQPEQIGFHAHHKPENCWWVGVCLKTPASSGDNDSKARGFGAPGGERERAIDCFLEPAPSSKADNLQETMGAVRQTKYRPADPACGRTGGSKTRVVRGPFE